MNLQPSAPVTPPIACSPRRFGLWSSAFLVCAMLSACGGSSTSNPGPDTSRSSTGVSGSAIAAIGDSSSKELSSGVSAVTTQAGFGQPQDAKAVAAMAKRLSKFFDGRYAKQPELLTGTSGAAGQRKAGSLSPREVYRFFNTQTGVHFFTVSVEERDWVRANLPWFQYEGPAFFAMALGDEALTPVFRFYNKVSATHFYTVSPAERDEVIAKLSDVFTYEGVSWHASGQTGAGWNPIFRFYNTQTGTHFYTASTQERNTIQNTLPNYVFEGIGYYVRVNSTAFTPLVHPDNCRVFPAPVLAAGLPTSYSAMLLGSASESRPFLNNSGAVAYGYFDRATNQQVIRHRLSNDGVLRTIRPASPYFSLLSMDHQGRVLLNEVDSMPPVDQRQPLEGMKDAVVHDGLNAVPVSGLKIPSEANHRAGRFTFFEGLSPVTDGSGRAWAYTSVPSYLDGTIVGRILDTLSLANRQIAVNHCGWGLDMSGRTESGLIWMNGNVEIERWSFQFGYGQNDSLRILATNNRRAVVGYSEGWPVAEKMIGYVKFGANQERAFDNFVPLDINEKLVAIGNRVEISSTMPPPIVTQQEGYLFTIDGQPQPIKNRVPSLNQEGTKIMPLKINDNLQILANVVLACSAQTNTNSLGEACGTSYAYLLTPQ